MLLQTGDWRIRFVPARDPLGEFRRTSYLWHPRKKIAFIEMAKVSGLALVPPSRRNPWKTTTFGLGQVVQAALKEKPRTILLGLGGSATHDAGCGMAQALGAHLLDVKGRPIAWGAEGLAALSRMDLSKLRTLVGKTKIIGWTDIRAPLAGAIHFAPQKGATAKDMPGLSRALASFAKVAARDAGKTVSQIPGGGAAGGLGAGLAAYFGAALQSGFVGVALETGLARAIAGADLVITGEGYVDAQSLMGKGVGEVCSRAAKNKVPVLCVAGGVDKDALRKFPASSVRFVSLTDAQTSRREAMQNFARIAEGKLEKVLRETISSGGTGGSTASR